MSENLIQFDGCVIDQNVIRQKDFLNRLPTKEGKKLPIVMPDIFMNVQQ